MEFTVETKRKEEFVDITVKVQEAVRESAVEDGICLVYTPHTTAAITINENADPDVRSDIQLYLKSILSDPGFVHKEGNSHGHVKSTLIGCSEQVIVEGGALSLGSWQGIFFCEFDGPRKRKVQVKVVACQE